MPWSKVTKQRDLCSVVLAEPAPAVDLRNDAKGVNNMTTRIAINGFGRTGRCALRHALKMQEVSVVAVNGTSDAATMGHLFKYDSTYGIFPGKVEIKEKSIIINGKEVLVFAERNPEALPWKALQIDVVLECTGIFKDKDGAEKHLKAGAKKVVIGAPSKGEDVTIVLGVNDNALQPNHKIISNASCTTNCLAPVMKVLNDSFGVEKGFMTTIHAYTSDQQLLDKTHKDLRRARAAAVSMIPTSTGATKALKLVIPELKDKLTGLAIRVPIETVSLIDVNVILKKQVTKEEVNKALKDASENHLKNILGFCDEPLVSCDFKGDERSAIVDGLSTEVIGNMVKVLAWYDNEWAYAKRLVELAAKAGDHYGA